jgi:hypothetical protein
MKHWFALTPALSPRRGSAVGSARLTISSAAFYKLWNAATGFVPEGIEVALPLLGERAGVRADVSSRLLGTMPERMSAQRFALARVAPFTL